MHTSSVLTCGLEMMMMIMIYLYAVVCVCVQSRGAYSPASSPADDKQVCQ